MHEWAYENKKILKHEWKITPQIFFSSSLQSHFSQKNIIKNSFTAWVEIKFQKKDNFYFSWLNFLSEKKIIRECIKKNPQFNNQEERKINKIMFSLSFLCKLNKKWMI